MRLFIAWIKKMLGIHSPSMSLIGYEYEYDYLKKKLKKNNSDEIKREMCEKALKSHVCPHECDICAWNTLK